MAADDTIRLNGHTFRRAFSAEVPEIADDRRAALRESIVEFGVLDAVDVREATEPAVFDVIDGWNRLGIAAELDIDCPYRVIRASDDDARKMALDLAAARRQLDAEQLRLLRVKRVAEKRAEGKSLQQIADEEGVSKTRVRQDLEVAESTVQGGAQLKPEKVKGKDGKVRPAKPKKKKTATPDASKDKQTSDASSSSAQTSTETPEKDAWGIPVQPHAAEAFAAVPKFKELVAAIRSAQRLFNEVANLPGGKFLTLPDVSSYRRGKKGNDGEHADRFVHPGLETALGQVKNAVPTHTVCPYRFADGPHPDDCRTCRGLDWTPPLSDSIPQACIARAKEVHGV